MPHEKLQKKQIPSFVRLDTLQDMAGMAKILAMVRADVREMELAKKELDGDEEHQKSALMNIAISGEDAAVKASKARKSIVAIRAKLESFLKQVEADASN